MKNVSGKANKLILIFTITVLMCILLVFGILYFSQDSKEKYYPITEEYVSMSFYTADKDEYLGRKGREAEDILGGVYTLKGLPKEEYILHEQYSIISPNGTPEINIYMNKNSVEPIVRYEVNRIKINFNGREILIDNKTTIDALLSVRKNTVPQNCEEPSYLNASFYFDSSCNLIWKSGIVCDGANNISLICFNVKENSWYSYNVSTILDKYFDIQNE